MFNGLKGKSALLASTVVAGLILGQPASAQVESVKIAAPFGMTGAVGPFAKPYVPALELAIKYINDNGASSRWAARSWSCCFRTARAIRRTPSACCAR